MYQNKIIYTYCSEIYIGVVQLLNLFNKTVYFVTVNNFYI